jgi:hypothetical protein
VSTLATLEHLWDFLGLEWGEEEELLQQLLDEVEATFVAACRRQHRPFQGAELGRVEEHDGSGSTSLWLHYPVTALATVTLGADHEHPDETLTAADLHVVAGRRRIQRRNGATFGALDAPGYVRVTYNAAADLPLGAGLAVVRVAAAVYRQRGSEDVKSERSGTYSSELAAVADSDPLWQAAVEAHREIEV